MARRPRALNPNFLGIEGRDAFSIEAIYSAALLANVGLETLTPDIDPSLSFELHIGSGPAVVWALKSLFFWGSTGERDTDYPVAPTSST